MEKIMNLRAIAEIENFKEDRRYVMHLPMGVPFEEAKTVADEFKAAIEEMERQHNDQIKTQLEKEPEENPES